MKKNFRNIILILLIIFLNQKSYAKPLPPGSGEGDVPANILILLDSSDSMGQKLPGGASHGDITGIQYDSNGNIYVTQDTKNNGVVKFDTDGALDDTFNDNEGSWTGRDTDTCTVRFDGTSFHANAVLSTTQTKPNELRMGQNVKDMSGTTMSEVLFMRSSDKSDTITGFDPTDGSCKYIIELNTITLARNIEVIEVSNETHLLVTGCGTCSGSGKNWWIESYNLTKRDFKVLEITGSGPIALANSGNNSINSDYTRWYVSYKGHIFWWNLEAITDGLLGTGSTLYSITDTSRTIRRVEDRCLKSGSLAIPNFYSVNEVEVSPDKSDDGDDIIITVSSYHLFQKLEVNGPDACTVLVTGGTFGTAGNAGSVSGGVLADNIYLKKPRGLHVTTNRILIGDQLGHVHEIDEDLFTATDRDTAWRRQMGTDAITRWTGAKAAIRAVLSDSSLTSGAHFGFGHWNAGQGDPDKHGDMGGKWCHHNEGCEYYGTWQAPDGFVGSTTDAHPKGKSSLCHSDACLMVGISEEGYKEITNVIESIGTAWGTDATAFAQMAYKYFIQDANITQIIDSNSPCQLNYVIIIGDGEWKNHDTAASKISELRQQGVKTIVIGYGDGIRDSGRENFNKMAVSGSCDVEGGEECHAALFPETPNELKSQLEAIIRQILAERLSFTAPSITATIQEGGSLYQAQFAYEQYGEWHGTILRKTLKADGTVEHDMSADGNWDAGAKIKHQAGEGAGIGRNIWSAIRTDAIEEDGENRVVSYIGGTYAWNNFHEDHKDDIKNAFESLDYSIPDYYPSTSSCGDLDEETGLINFMRGDDFFNYQGDCAGIDKTRNHVLGDIYHSQLIEVGEPKANMNFSGTNQEAYWRAMNDYQTFKLSYADRRNIIYAGSNSGMLHAIYADGEEGGTEAWAFIPPPMIGMLPKIINKNLEGKVRTLAQTEWINDNVDGESTAEKIERLGPKPTADIIGGGGSNAIFGVDGSPVVHDVYIKGLDSDGNWETDKHWHSILFVPFGRGGAGFSVLDVTNQLIKNNQGPMHMFSIYNDSVNSRVLLYEHDGKLVEKNYSSQTFNSLTSLEAKKAKKNEKAAEDADIVLDATGETYTNRDSIASCQTNANATSGKFRSDGTNSCYEGTTFTFNQVVNTIDGTTVDSNTLTVEEYDYSSGEQKKISGWTAKMKDGKFVITFPATKYINKSRSSLRNLNDTNRFTVSTSCTAAAGIDAKWDYSQLGETWSAPKIFRIPSVTESKRNDIAEDTYVAVMGGGIGSGNRCAGSAVYIIDLENNGEIYGAGVNSGPITIVDTTPEGILNAAGVTIDTEYGSDIANALPSSPIVITPDTAPGIPWRGAMVYFNDLEGKITKINLTNSTKNGADLFDQTTLFNLEANTINKRYSYFDMDAGIGQDTNKFWLFGGTGNFQNLGGYGTGMDNILYGIKDPDFPFFKHLNSVEIPRETESDFLVKAHEGANAAKRIFDHCLEKTGETSGNCPSNTDAGWVIHLDTTDDMKFRKMSGAPKIFQGQVYYPVYQPPEGQNKCNVGDAYICAADDECGNNTSNLLDKVEEDYGKKCSFIRQGILSEIVVFGDQLFANVAGPSEDEDTLFQTYAIKGEVSSTTSNWRDSSN